MTGFSEKLPVTKDTKKYFDLFLHFLQFSVQARYQGTYSARTDQKNAIMISPP